MLTTEAPAAAQKVAAGFGLARDLQARLRREGYLPGLPEYLEPDAIGEHVQQCRELRCPRCSRHGLDYHPFCRGERDYTVLGICPRCAAAALVLCDEEPRRKRPGRPVRPVKKPPRLPVVRNPSPVPLVQQPAAPSASPPAEGPVDDTNARAPTQPVAARPKVAARVSTPAGRRCRHCGRLHTWRGHRRLCPRCWETPALRNLYPPSFSRVGVLGQNRPAPLPEPTQALPGSREKVEVLAQRAAAGQQLWHPADAVGCTRTDRSGTPCALRSLLKRKGRRDSSRPAHPPLDWKAIRTRLVAVVEELPAGERVSAGELARRIGLRGRSDAFYSLLGGLVEDGLLTVKHRGGYRRPG